MNNWANLLRRMGRLSEALDLLRQRAVNSKFALEEIRYNLACYECLSGNLEEAKRLIVQEIAAQPASREIASTMMT